MLGLLMALLLTTQLHPPLLLPRAGGSEWTAMSLLLSWGQHQLAGELKCPVRLSSMPCQHGLQELARPVGHPLPRQWGHTAW